MKTRRLLTSALLACLSASALFATTVIPPTFDELVGRAELIFQGSVTNVRAEWAGEGAQRHIQTYVTFRVEDSIKGKPGNSYTISMLGGTVAGQTMQVTDAPSFKLGDRDILFVEHNGEQFIPLVGIMHGRYRIQQSAGREIVASNDGRPLTDVASVGKDDASGAGKAAMSAADFKNAVRSNLQTSQSVAREQ